jgi:hypothetical protein
MHSKEDLEGWNIKQTDLEESGYNDGTEQVRVRKGVELNG